MAKALVGAVEVPRRFDIRDIELARARAQRDRVVEFVRLTGLPDEHIQLLLAPNINGERSVEERTRTIAETAGFAGTLVLVGVTSEGELRPLADTLAAQQQAQQVEVPEPVLA